MANQQVPGDFNPAFWDDFNSMDVILTQEELDTLIGDTSEFAPFLSNDAFEPSQFMDPMVEDFDILENPTIDPSLLGLGYQAYTYGGPSNAVESFNDRSLMYQAQNAQFSQQNFQFDDSNMLDYLFDAPVEAPLVPIVDQTASPYPLEEYLDFQLDDNDNLAGNQTVAPPAKQLYLPAQNVSRPKKAHRKRNIPVAIKSEFASESGVTIKSEFAAGSGIAIKSEAGPSTPITRRPLANISPLKCTGQIKVINQIKKTGGTVEEVPYKYSVYKPLRPWGTIKYTDRGYLDEKIRFSTREMREFISNHPLGDKLVLRIEKHPYEMKCRETGKPQYLCCRAQNCAFSDDNRFTVGDLRVAIDEVTGRFGPNDIENNCPYFAAGFIHLECLESMVDTTPLANAGILVPDRRGDLPHEPERATKQPGFSNNKMALVKKQITEYEKWVETHPVGGERAKGKHTLNAAMWIAGQRASRIKSRFPPHVSTKDVEEWIEKNKHSRGWGGRRMANGTVAEMESKIAAGREHEIIAPRNGPSGKRGMIIGSTKKLRKKRSRRHNLQSRSNSDSSSGSDSSSDSDSDSQAPRHRQKRRRSDNPKAESRKGKQPRRRRSSTPDVTSSRLTYFDSTAVLPKRAREGSSDSLREISAEQAMATTNRTSKRIKKEVETYVISDDDNDSEKENIDPTYKME